MLKASEGRLEAVALRWPVLGLGLQACEREL